MDNVKEMLLQFLYWIAENTKNLVKTLIGLFTLWVIGFILVFGVPNWVTKAAIEDAKGTLERTTEAAENMEYRYTTETKWYVSAYAAGVPEQLFAGNGKLQEAQAYFKQVEQETNPDRKLELTRAVKGSCLEALEIYVNVGFHLTNNSTLRYNAWQRHAQITGEDNSSSNFANAMGLFQAENPAQLSKYTDPAKQTLEKIQTLLNAKDAHLNTAKALLPENNSLEGIGDPNLAQAEMDAAKALIDEINVLSSQVTGELSYLKKTKDESTPRTSEALTLYTDAEKHIKGIKASGFWLISPTANLEQASELLKFAQATLENPIAGKVDYPAAYEAAIKSSTLSQSAVKGADAEVNAANETARYINGYADKRQNTQNQVNEGNSAMQTLQGYHANGAWNRVSGNMSNAANLLIQADELMVKAKQSSAPEVQKYIEAYEAVIKAYSNLDDAQSLSQEMVNFRTNLESYRGQWPAAESSAASAINAETSQISSYGSYSSSAQSDYHQAVALLSDARIEASNRYFQPAVEKANLAESTVIGTGDEAEEAYDDYKDRQRRAEEARKRAEEEAARQRQNQNYGGSNYGGSSGGSSGGGGYGGSGYGGSSGGSSGGGGYGGSGGGSSNFGGGGGDSDW